MNRPDGRARHAGPSGQCSIIELHGARSDRCSLRPGLGATQAAATHRREVSNLAEAIALTKGSVTALSEKLSERQDRLVTKEARLKLLSAAPDVLSLEVRRLEAGVRKRVAQLREFLERNTEEARKVIESLLDGPMKFTRSRPRKGAGTR